MKITCDLCGSPLQMNPGGQGASCTLCGMLYTMERMREKLQELRGGTETPPPVVETPPIQVYTPPTRVAETPPAPVVNTPPARVAETPPAPVVNTPPARVTETPPAPAVKTPPVVETPPTPVYIPSAEVAETPPAPVVKPARPKRPAAKPVSVTARSGFQLRLTAVSQPLGRDCILNCVVEKGFVTVSSTVTMMESTWLGLSPKKCNVTSIMHNGKLVSRAEEGSTIVIMVDNIKKKNVQIWAGGTVVEGSSPFTFTVPPVIAPPPGCPDIPYPAKSAYEFSGPVLQYFSELLYGQFMDCQIDFRVEMKAGARDQVPVDFLISDTGRTDVAVILCSKDEYNDDSIEATMKLCESRGITALRFFEEFANNADYVCERIRKALV